MKIRLPLLQQRVLLRDLTGFPNLPHLTKNQVGDAMQLIQLNFAVDIHGKRRCTAS